MAPGTPLTRTSPLRSPGFWVMPSTDEAGWQQQKVRGGETVVLDEPSLSLSVDELYDGIELER